MTKFPYRKWPAEPTKASRYEAHRGRRDNPENSAGDGKVRAQEETNWIRIPALCGEGYRVLPGADMDDEGAELDASLAHVIARQTSHVKIQGESFTLPFWKSVRTSRSFAEDEFDR